MREVVNAVFYVPAASRKRVAGEDFAAMSNSDPTLFERLAKVEPAKLARVLTTTGRKPPLRTDKFLGFRGEWLRQSLRCGGQTAQNPVTAHSFIPEKASRATMKRVNGPKWRGQAAKAQSLASKPPILTEVFGWMWSARGKDFSRAGAWSGCARRERVRKDFRFHWERNSPDSEMVLKDHRRTVNAVAVTADGRRAVSGSADNTVQVCDLEGGQVPLVLVGHTDGVSAVAVTADGRRAVSGSHDHTLRLWDLESGKEIGIFTAEGGMYSCVVAPDGRTIVATDGLSRIHFLRLVEADPTKPAIGETKIQLLRLEEPATDS
jgi:hypothetical protein